MRSEPERWISVDREVVESSTWEIRAFPGEPVEVVEEVPEPAEEALEPVAESAPVAEPAPPPRSPRPRARARRAQPVVVQEGRQRARRPLPLASILMIGVILFAGSVGTTVAFVLKWPPASSQRDQPSPRAQEAPRGDGGEKKAPVGGAGRDPIVVAAGDIACDPLASTFEEGAGTENRCQQAATAELVESLRPKAVLVLGDVQYEDARYWKYMRSYDRTWGRFKNITYPTPASGHDRFGGGGYRRYWGRRAAKPWYSFSVGEWHVISLNSNCGRVGGCDPGTPQERWLRADLQAHPAACTLAFWHEPRFNSSERAALKMAPIWQALSDFGVELVLSGDSHNYERFRPQDAAGRYDPHGIRQFVVGTGGKSLVTFEKRSPGSLFRNDTSFGVLELTLHPKRYDWRFVPVSGEGSLDMKSAACH